jgi:F-type H+-transporting ATPase subunit epsilon
MSGLHVTIVATDRVIYDDHVDQITLPTESGVIGVLPNHQPLIGVVKMGEMIIKKEQAEIPFAISGGVIEVRGGSHVIILADDTYHAQDINITEAEQAYERAKQAMQEKESMLDVDFARLQSVIDRELNRLNVAKKWRK